MIAVARNVPKKGLDQLVRAVNDARVDVCLRLVSDAPELAGPRVTVGALPPSAIPGALADAQVFALPCRIAEDGDQDGLPVALLEAMAAGLPVIHTPVGGIPEIADDTVGWRVPVDDPDALRAAIEAAASSPGERTRRGEAARARLHASDFVSERAAARLIDAWRRAEPR